MYISEVKIENFRIFGSGANAVALALNSGLTAIVGENDAGKTAIVDALRFVLGTRDQEALRLEVTDFHLPPMGGERAEQVTVRLTFSGLTFQDKGAFAEFLTYVQENGVVETRLVVTWVAKRSPNSVGSRRFMPTEWRTGTEAQGPLLDAGARSLLTATYLRPLRDAERAMSAGRGSRLSQILQHTKAITQTGKAFDKNADPPLDPKTLSVLGLGDYANHLLAENDSVRETRKKLNNEYLSQLSFAHDLLKANIGVSGNRDEAIRLRQLLEKLEVALIDETEDGVHSRGLGSNNLLFMACELLLLASESDGFPILLIEEPEAHLHPQRQLRLMAFLRDHAAKKRADGQQIQIIVTTHSPNLASEIKLDELVLLKSRHTFSLSKGNTSLSDSDYRFLERFLDVTKANLFFARAVAIVEGDAENILIPALARLLGRDFHHYGVSVVNVGGVGLGRYARVFMRSDPDTDGTIELPVACITDMDVMPDSAPWIIEKLKEGEVIPKLGEGTRRKWRVESDFTKDGLTQHRASKRQRASGQRVETFVADRWTLEYDLARFGLGAEVWLAANYALNDDKLNASKATKEEISAAAAEAYEALSDGLDQDELASHVYAKFEVDGASKAVAAQYLVEVLERRIASGQLTEQDLRQRLPVYLVGAIEHVTEPIEESFGNGAPEAEAMS